MSKNAKVATVLSAIAIAVLVLAFWIVGSLTAPNEDLDRFNRLRDCKNSISLDRPPAEVEWREARCDEFYGE